MRNVLAVCIVAAGAMSAGLHAQAQDPAKPAAIDRSGDEKAIKSLVESLVKAFNAGDATAAVATYCENAVLVDEDGEVLQGRAALKDQFAASFAANPGSKIAIQSDSLRFVDDRTAIEVGKATITPTKGAPEVTKFMAVYVKQGDQWLQSLVRDESISELTPHEHLVELEWLVGHWVNESEDALVNTTCAWDKGGNFLVRDFTVKTAGRPVLSGTQRIGWDPLKRQFKTWIFDSEGGHGEGYFSQASNQWVVKVQGVNQLGKPITATNTITRFSKDRLGWQSSDRTVGGTAIPGVDEFVVVRKPPEPTK